MEQQKPLPLTTTNGAAPANGAKYTKWKGRPDHEQMMLEAADVFGRKPDFTVSDLQAWFRDPVSGRKPSESFICDLLQEMIAERLVEKLERCRARFRLYRIVKSDAVQLKSEEPTSPRATPQGISTSEIERSLSLLESVGIDTTKARAGVARANELGLVRALELKAHLEALATKS